MEQFRIILLCLCFSNYFGGSNAVPVPNTYRQLPTIQDTDIDGRKGCINTVRNPTIEEIAQWTGIICWQAYNEKDCKGEYIVSSGMHSDHLAQGSTFASLSPCNWKKFESGIHFSNKFHNKEKRHKRSLESKRTFSTPSSSSAQKSKRPATRTGTPTTSRFHGIFLSSGLSNGRSGFSGSLPLERRHSMSSVASRGRSGVRGAQTSKIKSGSKLSLSSVVKTGGSLSKSRSSSAGDSGGSSKRSRSSSAGDSGGSNKRSRSSSAGDSGGSNKRSRLSSGGDTGSGDPNPEAPASGSEYSYSGTPSDDGKDFYAAQTVEVVTGHSNRVELRSAWITAVMEHEQTGTGTNQDVRNYASEMGVPGDQAGHCIACMNGGSGTDRTNIIPQSAQGNALQRTVEKEVRDLVTRENQPVLMEVRPQYDGEATRPFRVDISFGLENRPQQTREVGNPLPRPPRA